MARVLLAVHHLPLFFIYRGGGHPKGTSIVLLAVCGAPSIVYSSGHSIIVLRQSLARITSRSPSPRRRADETLRRSSAGLEIAGRHRIERVLNSEVPCVRYLICRIVMKTYDYINRIVLTLPLSVYEGTWTHTPLSLLCITMILRVRRNFFEITTFPNNPLLWIPTTLQATERLPN